jgi:hypothetical protein
MQAKISKIPHPPSADFGGSAWFPERSGIAAIRYVCLEASHLGASLGRLA